MPRVSPTLSPLLPPGPQLEVALQCCCSSHRRRSVIRLHSCQELSRVHCDDVTIPQQRERLKHRSTSGCAFWTPDKGAANTVVYLSASTLVSAVSENYHCVWQRCDRLLGLSLWLPHTLFHSCYCFDPRLLMLGLSKMVKLKINRAWFKYMLFKALFSVVRIVIWSFFLNCYFISCPRIRTACGLAFKFASWWLLK